MRKTADGKYLKNILKGCNIKVPSNNGDDYKKNNQTRVVPATAVKVGLIKDVKITFVGGAAGLVNKEGKKSRRYLKLVCICLSHFDYTRI